jgi:hypothetical protein
MGYVKTITQIAKELGKMAKFHTEYGLNPSKLSHNKELYELLQGAAKIDSKEFGRFGSLGFNSSHEPGVFGEYIPWGAQGRGYITLDQFPHGGENSKLRIFLHELAHAKQFRPDPKNVPLMKEWELASERLPYKSQPVEVAASRVSQIAAPRPELFTRVSNEVMGDTDIIALTQQGIRSKGDPVLYSDVRPYSGKGWLFGATPIFAAPALQSGREDS